MVGLQKMLTQPFASRHTSTMGLMQFMEDTIATERVKIESIIQALHETYQHKTPFIRVNKDLACPSFSLIHRIIFSVSFNCIEMALHEIKLGILNTSLDFGNNISGTNTQEHTSAQYKGKQKVDYDTDEDLLDVTCHSST